RSWPGMEFRLHFSGEIAAAAQQAKDHHDPIPFSHEKPQQERPDNNHPDHRERRRIVSAGKQKAIADIEIITGVAHFRRVAAGTDTPPHLMVNHASGSVPEPEAAFGADCPISLFEVQEIVLAEQPHFVKELPRYKHRGTLHVIHPRLSPLLVDSPVPTGETSVMPGKPDPAAVVPPAQGLDLCTIAMHKNGRTADPDPR